jgi:membrane protease YdiL (CAAX protease family)
MTADLENKDQYNLIKNIGIWALAAIPMGILGWIIAPALSINKDPLQAGNIRIWALTSGLIWQFVLSMVIVYREEGNLRWSTIQKRLWLQHPRDPKTGQINKRLWWWVLPGSLLFMLFSLVLGPVLGSIWTSILPFFAEPEGFAFGSILESPEYRVLTVGNWGFFALIFVMSVFNTVLGEEFLFRGVLLPKMKGVFRKWDWVANGLMFTLYHIHQPWVWLTLAPISVFLFALPARRYKSTWMAIIIHSAQNIFLLVLILGLVLGLA